MSQQNKAMERNRNGNGTKQWNENSDTEWEYGNETGQMVVRSSSLTGHRVPASLRPS